MTDCLPTAPLTLILGGARSGKSRLAERLVTETGLDPVYLATATAGDDEMAQRIARHRADRRDVGWTTVEEPLALADTLGAIAGPDRAVLVDCLTLWLSNLMGADQDPVAAREHLTAVLSTLDGPVVLVSNEVGQGIVPDNPLARRFRDEAGRLHQAVAETADQVILAAAGLALRLKPAAADPLPLATGARS